MKKQLILGLALLISGGLSAQEKTKKDTTRLNFGNVTVMVLDGDGNNDTITYPVKKKELDPSFWSGLDIGVNFFSEDGLGSLNNYSEDLKNWEAIPGKSLYFGINITEFNITLKKNHVYLTTGLGLSYSSMSFKNNVDLLDTNGYMQAVEVTDREYTKNKLRITSLHVPLLMSFQLAKETSISAGIVGQLRIGSKLKQKFIPESKSEQKAKRKDDFNLTNFGGYAQLRFRYKGIKVFANYGLSTLFTKNQGPQITPYTFGISIL
ncbi:MAG: hypothetical protein ACI9YL_001929 [Luteibaculaceae bacterium]|jgi:hypothetical protein